MSGPAFPSPSAPPPEPHFPVPAVTPTASAPSLTHMELDAAAVHASQPLGALPQDQLEGLKGLREEALAVMKARMAQFTQVIPERYSVSKIALAIAAVTIITCLILALAAPTISPAVFISLGLVGAFALYKSNIPSILFRMLEQILIADPKLSPLRVLIKNIKLDFPTIQSWWSYQEKNFQKWFADIKAEKEHLTPEQHKLAQDMHDAGITKEATARQLYINIWIDDKIGLLNDAIRENREYLLKITGDRTYAGYEAIEAAATVGLVAAPLGVPQYEPLDPNP